MTQWLKQSTAQTVKLGVFVDEEDGFTALTSLTIAQADIRLSKNGGAFAQTNNSAGATHDEAGEYGIPLDTTDTNTLGRLRVRVSESGALPVWADFMVVPAQVWDSLFGADKLQVHVDEMTAGIITAAVVADGAIDAATFAAGAITAAAIATNAIDADALAADAIAEINATVDTAISDAALATATNLATAQTSINDLPTNSELATALGTADDATLSAIATLQSSVDTIDDLIDTEVAAIITTLRGLVLAQGTIGATGNTTTALHLSGLTYGNDEINNWLLVIFDVSNSEYHSRWIEDWADTGDLATVATLPFTPQASTDLYWLLPVRQDVTGGSGLDAAGVRAAVGLASANLDTQLADLPTNAELATSQASADDATLAAIAALNNLSAAQVNTEVDSALADVGLTTTITGRIDAAITSRLASGSYTTPPTTTAIRQEMDSNSTQLAAIVGDTNELQTDLTNGGRLDLLIDAILADTNELQTDWANGGRLDLLIDTLVNNIAAILEDTGTSGVVISQATRQAIADEILSRSVANVEATANIYTVAGMILAAFESSIAGTVWTINRTNGSTQFATRTVTVDDTADPITGVS